MKKLLLPALLLAGAASYANAEEVVLFQDDFSDIAPWCSDAVIDNFAENDEAVSTPRWDASYILDEEKGNERGEYYLRNYLWSKGYWADGITNEGVATGDLGSECLYFGRYFLKFGKKNNQANFRFNPAFGQDENFKKEIGTPAKFTFNWGPWRAGKNAMDVVTLSVQIANGGTYEEIDQFTHELPSGSPLTWFDAEVDLTDFEITPETRIRIQPVGDAWQAAGQHRWCLDNLKVVYGEAEGGNEGEGNVWYSEDFETMFEPWYGVLDFTDPVGTNDTTGDLGISMFDETPAANGATIKTAFMDPTLVTVAGGQEFCKPNNFLCWILDGKVHASYYVYRFHKGYIRFGVDNILGGVCLPSVTIPEDAENVYFEFDWCPTKNANGEYSEAILQVAQQDEAAIFIPEIHHNMQTGDPYAWKHECFSLYDDCDNFTPNTLRFLISTSQAAGYGWPEGDGKQVDGSFYLDNIRISDKPTTGVNNIAVEDNANAPVEYFNLQGVRVANPENGLYIRRQGNKATKIFVR